MKKSLLSVLCTLFSPLMSHTLLGEEGIAETAVQEGATFNYLHDFLYMLASLAFVIILIFLSIWVLKKILHSRFQTMNQGNRIKIVERRVLTAKSSLYLLDIGGKGILIGESAAGIHLLTELPQEEPGEEGSALSTSPSATFPQAIKETFLRYSSLKRRNKTKPLLPEEPPL